MAYKVIVDPENRCALYRIYGVFRINDCQESKAQAMSHQAFDLGFTHITDLTDVTKFDTDFSSMSLAATELAKLLKDAPAGTVNYIVAPADIHFGLARMYQQLMDGKSPLEVIIVRSRTELTEWMHLEDTQLAEMLDQAAEA